MTKNETSAIFRLTDSEATLAAYRYAFTLKVTFTLLERTLAVDYRVVNLNDRTMFFSLGSHSAFNLPAKLGPLEDWSIQFETVEEPGCYRVAENLVSSAPEPYEFTAGNSIALTSDTFTRNALIFKAIRSRSLKISHREHGVRLLFDTGGAPTLGIWAKPAAPYVCLEPWFGFDDGSEINPDLRQKPDMRWRAATDTFTTGYRIILQCAAATKCLPRSIQKPRREVLRRNQASLGSAEQSVTVTRDDTIQRVAQWCRHQPCQPCDAPRPTETV